MEPDTQFHDSPIQQQFEKIEDILRDDAHEGIGEAVADLRNMVAKLELHYWTVLHQVKNLASIANSEQK